MCGVLPQPAPACHRNPPKDTLISSPLATSTRPMTGTERRRKDQGPTVTEVPDCPVTRQAKPPERLLGPLVRDALCTTATTGIASLWSNATVMGMETSARSRAIPASFGHYSRREYRFNYCVVGSCSRHHAENGARGAGLIAPPRAGETPSGRGPCGRRRLRKICQLHKAIVVSQMMISRSGSRAFPQVFF